MHIFSFFYPVCQIWRIAISTSQKIECCDIYFKFGNIFNQWQSLILASSISVQIKYSFCGLQLRTMEVKPYNRLIILISNSKIFPENFLAFYYSLVWPVILQPSLHLWRRYDCFPGLLVQLHYLLLLLMFLQLELLL